jgi:hypothetical protein
LMFLTSLLGFAPRFPNTKVSAFVPPPASAYRIFGSETRGGRLGMRLSVCPLQSVLIQTTRAVGHSKKATQVEVLFDQRERFVLSDVSNRTDDRWRPRARVEKIHRD